MRDRQIRLLKIASAAVCFSLSAGVVATQAAPGAAPDGQKSVAAWKELRFMAQEQEGYSSLKDMAAAADLVAKGRVVRLVPGRVIEVRDIPGLYLTFALADLKIEQVYSGPEEIGTAQVEIYVPSGARERLGEIQTALASSDTLMLLRRIRTGPDVYRLVNTKGLWVDSSDGLVTPLAETFAAAAPGLEPSTDFDEKKLLEDERKRIIELMEAGLIEKRELPDPATPKARNNDGAEAEDHTTATSGEDVYRQELTGVSSLDELGATLF